MWVSLLAFAELAGIVLILILLLSIVIWTIKNNISPMPTGQKVMKQLMQELPERLDGKIVDLGSGWGNLANALSKKYPNTEIIGFETSQIPHYVSCIFFKRDNLQFKRCDFFSVDLSEFDLVICYLYPEAMTKLKEKFQKELKPSALIISHTFAIPGWQPTKVIQVDDMYKTKIYFYSVWALLYKSPLSQ